MRPRATRLALVAAALALAAAGCGGDAPEEESVALVGDAGYETVETPGFPDASTPVAHLVGVRTGFHAATDEQPAFDRIVLEFEEGAVEPSWRVGYVVPPVRQDGSGLPVELDGEAFLEVRLTPASSVDLDGEEVRPTYEGPTRIEADGYVGTELVRTGDFEATLTWALGLRERAPFASAWLDGPPRLVVDVVHEAPS